MLLRDGADPSTFYEDDMNVSSKTILHIACEKGRLECASLLIDYGADLNARDNWGQSPLMFCMITQYHEIADMMLDRDPDISYSQDRFGKSSLHSAAESGCLESIRVLLSHDAFVDIRTDDGLTAAMIACCSKELDPAPVLRLLIEGGCDVNIADRRCKRTALQVDLAA